MSATAQLCSPTISPKVVCDSLILALSIDPLSATAQLCSPKISPKVVCDSLILALSIDPLSATAQLCSPTISPKVVRYFSNPCIVYHQLILCLQLHNYAVLRSLLKSYAIVVI